MRREDKKSIAALFADAEVRRYLGGALSKRNARRRARSVEEGTTSRFWGVFAVEERASDGVIGLVSFDHQRGPWQLSYEFQPASWGRGFAGEACSASLAWFWSERQEVSEVIAVTQAANERSCRLLDRLGARPVREFIEFDAMQREYVLSRSGQGSDESSSTA